MWKTDGIYVVITWVVMFIRSLPYIWNLVNIVLHMFIRSLPYKWNLTYFLNMLNILSSNGTDVYDYLFRALVLLPRFFSLYFCIDCFTRSTFVEAVCRFLLDLHAIMF
jgi:hypothetical protein